MVTRQFMLDNVLVWLFGKNRPITLARRPLPVQAELGDNLCKEYLVRPVSR
jgi:hypothetical protein